MAVSVSTELPARVLGAEVVTVTKVTCDNSYASEGEPLTNAQLGVKTLLFPPICEIINGSESSTLRPTNAYVSGEKLHLIDSATGKEMESTKDMSKVVVRVIAFGSMA